MRRSFLYLVAFLLINTVAFGACVVADALWKEKIYEKAIYTYEQCAYDRNDSIAQYKLATFYLDGNEAVEQDIRHALFFFRLASENGYAPAQRELAKLVDVLDSLGDVGKQGLAEWKAQMEPMGFDCSIPAFSWALLAADKKENKWFYPTEALFDEQAADLVKKWTAQKGQAQKGLATEKAVEWKQLRLLKSAEAVLSPSQYNEFLKTLTSNEKGQFVRSRKKEATEELKKLLEQRK